MSRSEKIKHLSSVASTLIRDHGLKSPFMFLDSSQVESALERFRRYMPQVRLFYAVKANPAPALLSFLSTRGLSFDVASSGEIDIIKKLGISGDAVFLSTPIKRLDTIESMFRASVAAFAVDTITELEKIAQLKKKEGRVGYHPKSFVRIHIESKNVKVDLNTKFGCSVSEALAIIQRSMELNIPVGGVCFHVGSQSLSPDNYFMGIATAMLLGKEAQRRFGLKIPVINIGGGFCDPAVAEKSGINLDNYYRDIGDACQEAIDAGFELYAEPGRCLVNAAGTAISSVIGTNVRKDKRWAYLDDGIYGCFSIKTFENPEFNFQLLNSTRKVGSLRNAENNCSWTIAGPTCDSLDVISLDAQLPVDMVAGDVVLTPDVGAYSIATANSFNGFPLPQCYFVVTEAKDGKVEVSIYEPQAVRQQIVANS